LEQLRFFVNRLRTSFWALPVSGCLVSCAAALVINSAEAGLPTEDLPPAYTPFRVSYDTAQSVLSTIAGATATIISLVYSLTLVVFTLAAGSLGPRLIESFSDNRPNQITISVTSSTFTFSLLSLYLMDQDGDVHFSVLIAMVLALISIVVLIYYVHDTASRILVDNEIARNARGLHDAIRLHFTAFDRGEAADADADTTPGHRATLTCGDGGYVATVNVKRLVHLAKQNDACVRADFTAGDFIFEYLPIATVEGARQIDGQQLRRCIVMADARTPGRDVLFCVRLLVELALRALSPGVNDPYTAISCVDHLSRAFSTLVQQDPLKPWICDEDGTPRLRLASPSIEAILDAAYNPLRRAAKRDVMVSEALLNSIAKLMSVAKPGPREDLIRHGRLIADEALSGDLSPTDRERLRSLRPSSI